MEKKYLLYLDILGFKRLVDNEEHKIKKIYDIIDKLNAHKHPNFNTIVFSDTMLIYNEDNPKKDFKDDHEYLVMYLIEFAQELQKRLVGTDVFFRAQLRYDYFCHYKLNNIECYYGKNLIDAYLNEPKIPIIGILIDNEANQYNSIYPAAKFSNDLSFIYVNQRIESLVNYTQSNLPLDPIWLETTDAFYDILWDIEYLKQIYFNSINVIDATVRIKYINTWHMFLLKYPKIMNHLLNNNFEPESISPKYNWKQMKQIFYEELDRKVL